MPPGVQEREMGMKGKSSDLVFILKIVLHSPGNNTIIWLGVGSYLFWRGGKYHYNNDDDSQ